MTNTTTPKTGPYAEAYAAGRAAARLMQRRLAPYAGAAMSKAWLQGYDSMKVTNGQP